MVTRAGALALWLAVVLSGGWAGAQPPPGTEPDEMTLEELLRLQQVVDEVLRDGAEEAAAAQPEAAEAVKPVPGLGDLFPPLEEEPQTASPVAGSGVPDMDAIVEGVGVDPFLETQPPAPVEGADGRSPVAGPVAAPDDAAAAAGGVAAGAQAPGGRESEASTGQESPDDSLLEPVRDVPAVPGVAALPPPLTPPDGGGLRLGRDGHPVRLRPPSAAYLRRIPRGTLGYRAPLVAKQRVGPMVVGGVYIPAHEAWVVLRDGHWQLVGDTTPVAAEHALAAAESRGESRTRPAQRKGFWRRLLGRIGPAPGRDD